MPELIEQMYCSQQIVIPPKFPYILKRYCKAAIKTQPYDLLRWSFEYFRALADHRSPPVKLRLEYPIYSTEGGLTRGCLKVLANQLSGMDVVPLPAIKAAWQGFCLDHTELRRILCLCEVYLREETVPFLHFIAVAGGLLTKCLTHTMILLCEALTKEPDGGSAAIPLKNFITMYRCLANMDASKDVKYFNGYREGYSPTPEAAAEEAEATASHDSMHEILSDDYWQDPQDYQRLTIIDDHVARTARLSVKLNLPVLGKIERSPSVERAGQIERENYMRERKGRVVPNQEVEKKLKAMSSMMLESHVDMPKEEQPKEEEVVDTKMAVEIFVFDEDDKQIPYGFYGEPRETDGDPTEEVSEGQESESIMGHMKPIDAEAEKIALFLAEVTTLDFIDYIQDLLIPSLVLPFSQWHQVREDRLMDLERTFDEIAAIVDRFKSASYDLGMVAGRQMSTTSGEFIVQHIEREIMEYINDQIAVLPDPDLKKKKAKPEEVMMIREILERFLDENMDVIVPEVEEVEEEEQPIPEITLVYAVPGIGAPVDEDIINEFVEYMREVAKVQADVAMPRNIRHFLCPPLEKYTEYKYEEDTKKKEEVPTGGVITD